ncbi:MAG TPA: Tex family protein [Gemmatales bacterium]|nr:Tex family protein [Gemmatales bacterium]
MITNDAPLNETEAAPPIPPDSNSATPSEPVLAAPSVDTPGAAQESPTETVTAPSPAVLPAVPEVTVHFDLGRIAQDLQIRKVQVDAVVHLLDEGNTIPFITRYRKERTGGLNEDVLRQIQKRVQQQRTLAERKQTILRNITTQGKLTDELREAILHCDHPKRLEDLYLPYKPKKKSLAAAAREKGLGELAASIWNRDPVVSNLTELLPTLLNPEKGLNTAEDILTGVGHILAEQIAELPEVRDLGRRFLWDTARLVVTKNDNVAEGQGIEFKDYFTYNELARQIPPHRILAINRGERENVLKAKFDADLVRLHGYALDRLPLHEHPHAGLISGFAQDAVNRLLAPSIEREIRRDLTERAEDHAIVVFARNLRRLLLQPPVHGKRILGIDPAYRTGCKLAALDETGNLLDTTTIYPFGGSNQPKWEKKKKKDKKGKEEKAEVATAPATQPVADAAAPAVEAAAPETPASVESEPPVAEAPAAEAAPVAVDVPAAEPASASIDATAEVAATRKAEARAKLIEFARQHQCNVIAIGNGTASRETEELVAAAIAEALPGVAYIIVNEAGASHYSTSPIAREEFPSHDATARGTISIGRRLVDPLSELVKIDPQNLGVGLYQHDIAEKRLKESLEGVVESCVNYVGVDLNTASAPLLRYVAGLNQLRAHAIVDYRKEKGPFKSREELRAVPGIGEITYTQAAGFLRIPNAENPFDNSAIHPESYGAAARLLEKVSLTPAVLSDGAALLELKSKLAALPAETIATELGIGLPTLHDLIDAIVKPGRDPRSELPEPIFKKGILQIEDLKPGSELKGTVQNVVDFGAFVDVGLKDSGLVHISQLANKFIKSPYDIVSVGDIVSVWVMAVDMERRRVSLTMIAPGTERKQHERHPYAQGQEQGGQPFRREQRQDRPPRGPRPDGPRPTGNEPQQGQHREGQRRFDQRGQDQRGQGRHQGGGGRFGGGRRMPPRHGSNEGSVPQHPPEPPHPPVKRKEKPKPKLTEAALAGKAPLRTFGELKALFETKKSDDEPTGTPLPVTEHVAPPASPIESKPADSQTAAE